MLEVHPFDIDIGQHKVMLNMADARERGLNAGDRVRVRAKGAAVTAILDVTSQMVKTGEIGIFTEAFRELKQPSTVEVLSAPRPASLCYIKMLMDKQKLSEDQIRTIVQDIVDNNLSDVELSAYITTSYIHNMDSQETEWLTKAMIETGDRIRFDTHPVMDKHSIGGVPGNKVSLLVVPIVAAAGLMIPKTSSRAITGAGGTADLMEILAPVEFSADEIKEITEHVGGVIAWGGATNIAPADDKLIRAEYALSIDPYSQMLASIMAKKGAVGADAIVINMPVGPGTKASTPENGRSLAKDLIDLGERLGIKVECAMTFGSSPVGRTIGPALEIKEALTMLEGKGGPNSLKEKSWLWQAYSWRWEEWLAERRLQGCRRDPQQRKGACQAHGDNRGPGRQPQGQERRDPGRRSLPGHSVAKHRLHCGLLQQENGGDCKACRRAR
jgi:AMP phosphorylase